MLMKDKDQALTETKCYKLELGQCRVTTIAIQEMEQLRNNLKV